MLVPVLNAVSDLSIRAPRYWDAQVRAQARMRDTKLDALLLLSDDSFALLSGDSSDSAVQIGLSTRFWRARVNGQTPLSDGWRNELNLGLGHDSQSFIFNATGQAEETNDVVTLREELSRPVADGRILGWRLGADVGGQPGPLVPVIRTEGNVVTVDLTKLIGHALDQAMFPRNPRVRRWDGVAEIRPAAIASATGWEELRPRSTPSRRFNWEACGSSPGCAPTRWCWTRATRRCRWILG